MNNLVSIITIICTLTLTACGVKPGSVDAPSGAKNDNFPRTYPSTKTDPDPAYKDANVRVYQLD